ncbi:MAG: four helix bundle protein, partial [Sedimenticolaceae bacterium]
LGGRPLDPGEPIDWGKCMNDPEVTMNNALPKNNLIATEKAIVAAAAAISLVKRVPAPLKSIADQVVRSASSVPANLSEGHGRSGRDRIHHWRIAYASAKEVDTHLRLLAAVAGIHREHAVDALRRFDEVRAITWRLLNPRC